MAGRPHFHQIFFRLVMFKHLFRLSPKRRKVMKYKLFIRSFSKFYFIINANFTILLFKISIDNEITFRKTSAK